MIIAELNNKLIEAYSVENLNRIAGNPVLLKHVDMLRDKGIIVIAD